MRFEREAKTVSQLSHPNICSLYDVGHENGTDYLVMEYLEGESLADRLAKGPLPLPQVLRYGIEIAQALDRAHGAGIVHRDLKPGNVMITKSGAKLLDFGLAKTEMAAPVDVTATLRKALTEEGSIVGTLQYMAPEQLEGREADARTDIFAFGALLYEMASGNHAFEGKSKASLIAAILTTDPPSICASQPASPPALDRLIRVCLSKDPDDRWQSAHDIAIELRSIGEERAAPANARHIAVLPWVIAAIAALSAITLAVLARRQLRPAGATTSIRSSILPPDNGMFLVTGPDAGPPAISHDAQKLVVTIKDAALNRSLWVRSLDGLEFRRIGDTDGATYPFWSPDDRYIAFFPDGKVRKVDLTGSFMVAGRPLDRVPETGHTADQN